MHLRGLYKQHPAVPQAQAQTTKVLEGLFSYVTASDLQRPHGSNLEFRRLGKAMQFLFVEFKRNPQGPSNDFMEWRKATGRKKDHKMIER